MSSFIPKTVAELLALSNAVMAGLLDNAATFPTPPFDSQKIGIVKERVEQLLDANISAISKLDEIRTELKNAVTELRNSIAEDRNYCKQVSGKNTAVYSKSGFKPAKTKSGQKLPGQCRNFRVVKQGLSKIEFAWKNPPRGENGGTSLFQLLGKEVKAKVFTILANPTKTSVKIPNQESGKVFEFCVIALNRKGAGLQSNSVIVKF